MPKRLFSRAVAALVKDSDVGVMSVGKHLRLVFMTITCR